MSTTRNAERSLTARSVVASTLLGSDPPRLPTWALVRSGEAFGIAAGTTRTALSRMAAAGEVVADGDGYRLAAPALLARRERQTSGRRGERRRWDGTWELAVVAGPAARSAVDRSALRAAARDLRLGALREGVWGRPANLPPASDRAPEASAVVADQCTWWAGARPSTAVALPWDLDGWADGARRLLDDLRTTDPSALADAFVVSAAVLRHLQADPLLPDELLPRRWPGDDLRRAYDGFDASFRRAWRSWLTAART